jgi:CheY-like chemotaxis protein
MQCPRCRVEINVLPDPGGVILCPGCGARLMTRSVPARAGSEAPSAPASSPEVEPPHPSSTMPPGTPLKKIRPPGEDTTRSPRKPPPPMADLETPASGMAPVSRSHGASNGHASLEQVLAEVQAVRETQQMILSVLLGRPAETPVQEPPGGELQPGRAAPLRTRRRKSVLLIDDDPATRDAAVAEMEQAEVPVRAVADGNSGIQAIAAEKPDVIALELDISGSMAGKDVINMIKATMEWVDIPILLYTRVPLESQKEARTVHGADDLVLKRSGPAALVSRVIMIFRRGS